MSTFVQFSSCCCCRCSGFLFFSSFVLLRFCSALGFCCCLFLCLFVFICLFARFIVCFLLFVRVSYSAFLESSSFVCQILLVAKLIQA